MNIFVLDQDISKSVQYHCNKHVVKMCTEYAQQLSTAHRVLDGRKVKRPSKSGKRNIDYYILPDGREDILYKACHVNHPCNVWVRTSSSNYNYLYRLYMTLCGEYEIRYGKVHMAKRKLFKALRNAPENIPDGNLTEFFQCMPDDCKDEDAVKGYRNFYRTHKKDFAEWKIRETPSWFLKNIG